MKTWRVQFDDRDDELVEADYVEVNTNFVLFLNGLNLGGSFAPPNKIHAVYFRPACVTVEAI